MWYTNVNCLTLRAKSEFWETPNRRRIGANREHLALLHLELLSIYRVFLQCTCAQGIWHPVVITCLKRLFISYCMISMIGPEVICRYGGVYYRTHVCYTFLYQTGISSWDHFIFRVWCITFEAIYITWLQLHRTINFQFHTCFLFGITLYFAVTLIKSHF